MTSQLFTVNSRKYDLSLRRSWNAHLIELTDEHIVLEGVFDQDVRHPDLGIIARNTRSIETFIFDRWYNYFVFFEPSGELRNYYINISMPPRLDKAAVDYVDLDIDIIIWPDGRIEVLDEAEFEENAAIYRYPDSVRHMVLTLTRSIKAEPGKFITYLDS